MGDNTTFTVTFLPTDATATENATNSLSVFDAEMEIYKIIVTCVLAIIMFGMGCAVDYQELVKNVKRPAGITTGLLCQIFMMPLLAYGLIKATSMTEVSGLVFMSIGCCPGGMFSNIITMFVDGDMPLSITMTTITNLLAFGTVPMWLYLYSWIENVDEDLRIPYSSLGISLASLVIPIILGILFRYKFLKQAKIIKKICGIIGFILLFVFAIAMIVKNEVPIVFAVDTILPSAVLPVTGMILSYAISCLPCLKIEPTARRTIAIETSIQNGNLATNIVMLTYAQRIDLFIQVFPIPLLYAMSQAVYNALLVGIYRFWKLWIKCRERKVKDGSCAAVRYQEMELS